MAVMKKVPPDALAPAVDLSFDLALTNTASQGANKKPA